MMQTEYLHTPYAYQLSQDIKHTFLLGSYVRTYNKIILNNH